MLLAKQLSKGIKKVQPTFFVLMKEKGCGKEVTLPKVISGLSKLFKDRIPKKLSNKPPPKKEVDHKIKVQPRAR